MNKQKLISVLQSRIAERRKYLADGWAIYLDLHTDPDTRNFDAKEFKVILLNVGITQKEDKQILKQLIEDERSIKEWKKAFAQADLNIWELEKLYEIARKREY